MFPAQIDKETGYRYYTMDQMAVLHRIMALKQAGFTIEDIKRFNSIADTDAFLGRKKAELLAKIAELTRQIAVLDGYMAEGGDTLETPVLIKTCQAVTEKKEDSHLVKFKELPETQAACIYHRGSYNDFPRSYALVLRYIEENGYEICGNIRENYIDGVWNKDKEDEWLSEIQIPVKKCGA